MKSNVFLVAVTVFTLPWLGCNKAEETAPPGPPASGSQALAPDHAASKGAAAVASTEAVELKLQWPVGERFTQRFEMDQNSETTIPMTGQPMKQGTTMGQDFNIHVKAERPGGGRELEVELAAMELSVMMGGQQVMSFDSSGESAGDANNPVNKALRELVGVKLQLLTDGNNRVASVEGTEQLAERMGANLRQPMRSMLTRMFGQDYFLQIMDWGRALPDRPVRPGDSWPVKLDFTIGPMGKITTDMTYTFKGWEQREGRRCARLDFTGTLQSGGTADAGLMGMSMNIREGKTSGQSFFDPVAGQFIENIIDQSMTALMSLPSGPPPGAGAAPGNMSMTNALQQKLTIKLSKVKTAK